MSSVSCSSTRSVTTGLLFCLVLVVSTVVISATENFFFAFLGAVTVELLAAEASVCFIALIVKL